MKTIALDAGRAKAPASNELVLTRLLDAPRELVWQAWTEPQHLARWCAPHDFIITHCTGELRVGASWRTCMVSPEKIEHWVGGVYREIVPVERLVFTHVWDDDNGRPGPQTLVKITLAEQGSQTLLKLHQTRFSSVASRDGHEIGWSESLDRLNDHLGQMQTENK